MEVTSAAAGEHEADFEVSDNPDEFSPLDASKVPVIVTLTKVRNPDFHMYVIDSTPLCKF